MRAWPPEPLLVRDQADDDRGPALGDPAEVVQVLQPVAVGPGEDQVGLERGRDPGRCSGCRPRGCGSSTRRSHSQASGPNPGKRSPGRVGTAVGGGVADLGRLSRSPSGRRRSWNAPCRRSKARRSSTVTTVSGSLAARSAMSITTASTTSSSGRRSATAARPG